MTEGTKVIVLVRTSTDDQSNGCDAQEAACRAEADRRGWIIVEVICEQGYSGRGSERPGLNRALEMVANGEAAAVLVAKLDRFSRSVVDFGHILSWLDAAGGALVALDLGVDTTTAAGRLVANVLASVAQWEAEAISERTSAALRARQRRGEAVSRPAVSADIAERIRSMRDGGHSLRAIANVLNAEGVPTARGAAQWSVSSVQTASGYQRPKRRKSADLPPVQSRRRRS